jgi:hypothetical protein
LYHNKTQQKNRGASEIKSLFGGAGCYAIKRVTYISEDLIQSILKLWANMQEKLQTIDNVGLLVEKI